MRFSNSAHCRKVRLINGRLFFNINVRFDLEMKKLLNRSDSEQLNKLGMFSVLFGKQDNVKHLNKLFGVNSGSLQLAKWHVLSLYLPGIDKYMVAQKKKESAANPAGISSQIKAQASRAKTQTRKTRMKMKTKAKPPATPSKTMKKK